MQPLCISLTYREAPRPSAFKVYLVFEIMGLAVHRLMKQKCSFMKVLGLISNFAMFWDLLTKNYLLPSGATSYLPVYPILRI